MISFAKSSKLHLSVKFEFLRGKIESKLGHPIHASRIKSIVADAGLFAKQPKNVANASSPEVIEIRVEHIRERERIYYRYQ